MSRDNAGVYFNINRVPSVAVPHREVTVDASASSPSSLPTPCETSLLRRTTEPTLQLRVSNL